jgi:hypothetical protein
MQCDDEIKVYRKKMAVYEKLLHNENFNILEVDEILTYLFNSKENIMNIFN